MMIISTYTMIPRSVSLLSCVPVAFAVDFILYKIKDYIDLKEFKDKKHEFNIDKCTKYQLIKRCKEKGLSKHDIDVTIKMFYDKLDSKQLAQYLSIEVQSAKNKKYMLKNKLK